MRTIGKRWPTFAPRGDFAWPCDICGVKWRRSQLRRDNSGLLVCPDDSGPDVVRIARAPHVQNNYGTGSETAAAATGEQDEGYPVIL